VSSTEYQGAKLKIFVVAAQVELAISVDRLSLSIWKHAQGCYDYTKNKFIGLFAY
jgi:hypothetical protein